MAKHTFIKTLIYKKILVIPLKKKKGFSHSGKFDIIWNQGILRARYKPDWDKFHCFLVKRLRFNNHFINMWGRQDSAWMMGLEAWLSSSLLYGHKYTLINPIHSTPVLAKEILACTSLHSSRRFINPSHFSSFH